MSLVSAWSLNTDLPPFWKIHIYCCITPLVTKASSVQSNRLALLHCHIPSKDHDYPYKDLFTHFLGIHNIQYMICVTANCGDCGLPSILACKFFYCKELRIYNLLLWSNKQMWGGRRRREGVVVHRRDSFKPQQGSRLRLVVGHGIKVRWL